MDKLAYNIRLGKFYRYIPGEKKYVELCKQRQFYDNCLNKICPVTKRQVRRFPKTVATYLREDWYVVDEDGERIHYVDTDIPPKKEITFSFCLQLTYNDKKITFRDMNVLLEPFMEVLHMIEYHKDIEDVLSVEYLYLNTPFEKYEVILPANTLTYLREIVNWVKKL